MSSPLILSADLDGPSLTMECGDSPVDDIVLARDLEPSGYFWEGVLRLLDPSAADRLELDSESDRFCVYGDVARLEQARQLLQPYVLDPDQMGALLDRADAEGVDLEDTEPESPVVGTTFLSRLLRRR